MVHKSTLYMFLYLIMLISLYIYTYIYISHLLILLFVLYIYIYLYDDRIKTLLNIVIMNMFSVARLEFKIYRKVGIRNNEREDNLIRRIFCYASTSW